MKTFVYACLVCICVNAIAFTQVVTVNSPSPWETLREQNIKTGILLDTANIEQKSIRMKLIKTENGRQSTVSNKVYDTSEIPENPSLGSVERSVLGGQNFYTLSWSIPGSDHEGTVAPLGMAVLSDLENDPFLQIKKIEAASDESVIIKAIGDSLLKVGSYGVAAGYTDSILYLYVEKDSSRSGTITFAFDGKNGKNAFVSYSDRFISYTDSSNSVSAYHYTRSFRNDTINYKKSTWYASMSKNVTERAVMLSIPWHDLGFLPFSGRTFGIAVSSQKDGETESIPSGAELQIPATWGAAIMEPK